MFESPEKMTKPDWPTLLDELKAKESIPSDSKLAVTLDVTRGYICSVRKGRKNISLELAKKIFSRLGRTFEIPNLERLFVPAKVRQYTINLSATRRKVILNANGECQLCGTKAPFQDRDGIPYLEVHHIRPFEDGGSDNMDNLIVLCPNCHRKINLNPSPEDKMKIESLAKEKTEVR